MASGLCHFGQVAHRRQHDALRDGDHHGAWQGRAPTSLLEALGLLPSEQRFLGHFLKSSSLCNAAEGCGLSEETARTYLKRVRAKLGVHRQMELAGLISGLVLPLHAADSPAYMER